MVGLTLALATGATSLVVSTAALIGLAAGIGSALLDLWPLFRRVLDCSPARAGHAIACRLEPFDTRLAAGIAGWRSRSGTFRRTDKFPARANWSRALASTSRKATRGVAALALAGWGLVATSATGPMLPLVGYLIVRAVGWLAAPALALTATRCLALAAAPRSPTPYPAAVAAGPSSAVPDPTGARSAGSPPDGGVDR